MLAGSPLLKDVRERGHVVPYGIDTSRFDPARVPEAVRERLRSRLGTPLVVAVGRLVYYKGLDLLIDGVSRLPVSLAIVGSGPMKSSLVARARDNPRVHFLDEVSDDELVNVLAAADCYVLASTSRAESFGLATVEAQAMEVPAVVTALGTGTTDAIADRKTGIAVAPGRAEALADGIRWILADEERRMDLARAARRRVVERHSEEVQAKRMLSVYKAVLRDGDAAGR
jgi:rhamnosyl/mannosyltransferase